VDEIGRAVAWTVLLAAALAVPRVTHIRRARRGSDPGSVSPVHLVVVGAVLVGVLTGFAAAVPYATRLASIVRAGIEALAALTDGEAATPTIGSTAGSSTQGTRTPGGSPPGGVARSTGARTAPPPSRSHPATGKNPITAAVRADVRGVVRVVGLAPACSLEQEGSGFVVSPHHVLTNAHVVHGIRAPQVQVAGRGYRYLARVVFYDPGVDLAVLDVPELPAPPLPVSTTQLPRGTAAVAAGFPLDGPLRLSAGNIQRVILDAGPAVGAAVPRERAVYQLTVVVRPGNSGGPLLTPDGRVAGVVFARGSTRTPVGFAITAAAALADVRSALAATRRVGTGSCG
jgi:S1-C subfamily serine protease